MGIAKRLRAYRDSGGRVFRGGKATFAEPERRPPLCCYCLRGEDAGLVVVGPDGCRYHDECHGRALARSAPPPVFAWPEGPSRRTAPADAGAPDHPDLLPRPVTDGRFVTHRDCGGAGCDRCRGTGYATMHPVAIAALERRLGATSAAPELPPAAPSRPAAQLAFDWS